MLLLFIVGHHVGSTECQSTLSFSGTHGYGTMYLDLTLKALLT